MRYARFRPFAAKAPCNVGDLGAGRLCEQIVRSILLILLQYLKPSLRAQRSNPFLLGARHGLLRGACHRARVRATRWLAMTADTVSHSRGAMRPRLASSFRDLSTQRPQRM